MATEVILPKLGQTMEEGTIVEWYKQEGDEVKRGEILFTVESDKATLESESPARGILRKILVPSGVQVPVLTPVAIITRTADEDISAYLGQPSAAGGAAAAGEAEEVIQLAEAAVQEIEERGSERAAGGRVFASPRARMRAREVGVDLGAIEGSGPNGRIVERDVLSYVESQPKATPMARKVAADLGIDLATVTGTGVGAKITQEDVELAHAARQAPPAPEVVRVPMAVPAPIKLPPVEVAETRPLSGLRGIIAERMAFSAHTAARVTLVTEVDATALVEVRTRLKDSVTEEWGFAPGYTDLLAMMVARALREYPYVNVRLNEQVIEQMAHVNLGMAVDAERGLLVPVIHDADQMGLRELGTRFRELVGRAREGKSLPDDLSGGTFTITNLGMFEIDAFTPVMNPPEAAILGVGRIQAKPVVRDGEIVARQMMTLSLAFDHRLVDGAPAARFLQRIKRLVENPYLLLG
jgi:pyruvate dehydrogenase E2 component (dihydrolipoamide acetyltransferase)